VGVRRKVWWWSAKTARACEPRTVGTAAAAAVAHATAGLLLLVLLLIASALGDGEAWAAADTGALQSCIVCAFAGVHRSRWCGVGGQGGSGCVWM
jgi:hypothetical protein